MDRLRPEPHVIRVAVVDDHRVVCRALRSYLESFPDVVIAGDASSGEEILRDLPEMAPDVVVMDLVLPGGMDGIEATRRVVACCPRTRVVVLTACTDEPRLIAALRAGATGYVRKDSDPELLLRAIREAARGRSLIDPSMAGAAIANLLQGGNDLTEREKEVLRYLARGHTNKRISECLGISEETAKTHVANILGKLQVGHRMEAAIYALKQGFVSLEEL